MGSRSAFRAALVFVALVGADVVHAGAASASSVPPNLIKDPGAEQAWPNGGTVGVPGWKADAGTDFTAIAYGTSGGFPTTTSPGSPSRGKNFFAGGTSGSHSGATQAVALTGYSTLIQSGAARFSLSGWLGGYSTQGDYAYAYVYWQDSAGGIIGSGRIGPVSESARGGVTGMLHRSTSGTVPRKTAKAYVHLYMVRTDGTYNDGYADDLSLTIHT